MESREISHKGIIEDIQDSIIKVRIQSVSACQSCHAKGVCSVADTRDKTVEVHQPGKDYKTGEKVNVILRKGMGYKALLYGYVYPFVLVLFVLIIMSFITHNEIIAGIVAIGSTIPYYFILYLFNNRLSKRFYFYIQKPE